MDDHKTGNRASKGEEKAKNIKRHIYEQNQTKQCYISLKRNLEIQN